MLDSCPEEVGPVVEQFKARWQSPKETELQRLFQKLPGLDPSARAEIRQGFDRLLGKLMHPLLDSLHQEPSRNSLDAMLAALTTLFRLKE